MRKYGLRPPTTSMDFDRTLSVAPQHTATPVRGVVGRRLALQHHLEAGAVILQASATLAQAAARGRAARAKAMGMRIRAEAG